MNLSQNPIPSGEIESASSRRRFLSMAGLATATAIQGKKLQSLATTWRSYTSPVSGASILYPSGWRIRPTARSELVYPHQSFALMSAPGPSGNDDQFPDLTTYSSFGAYLWLLHYDDVVSDFPAFTGFTELADLATRPTEYEDFARYGAMFSGHRHSFILRLWVGVARPRTILSQLNRVVSSLEVP